MESNQKRLLVAVDGSNQSLETVRYVGRLFQSENLEVTLFHVLSKIPEFFYDLRQNSQHHQPIVDIRGWERALQDSINRFISDAREALIEAGLPEKAITISIQERREGIARDILAESHKGYSGIALGRSGLSKFKDFIIGSVANKLIDTVSHIPICTVGGKPNPERVLIALDESEGAMRTVDFVSTMGSTLKLTLFHVVRGFGICEQRYENLLALEREESWVEAGKKEMESVFQEARTRLLRSGIDPKFLTTKLIAGASSRSGAIIKEAKEGGYGTIVVGRRGLSKVKEFIMGRVSRKVIQMARDHAVWVVD